MLHSNKYEEEMSTLGSFRVLCWCIVPKMSGKSQTPVPDILIPNPISSLLDYSTHYKDEKRMIRFKRRIKENVGLEAE